MIYPAYKWGGGYSKSEVDTLLTSKADSSHTHTKSQITDFPSYGTTANTICEGNDSRLSDARTPTSHTHTKSEITDFPSLATVATSGSYSDLSDKPTIPTVNNATLKIQKNGTDVKTFTANASSNVTCNITVPTKTSDLTNDSGFLTSHQSLSNYSTLANTIKSLSISGKTITYTKGDNTTGTLTTQDNNTWTAMVGATSSSNGSVGYVNAVPPKDGYNTKYLRADGTWQVPPDHTYTVNNATLTIQKNGTNVATFTSNASSNVTCNITVPTKISDLTSNVYTTSLNRHAINFDWDSHYSFKVGIKVDETWLGGILTTNNTTIPSKTSDLTNDSGFLTSHQDLSGYVPRSGGAVMTGTELGRTDNTNRFAICSGTDSNSGGNILLYPNALGDANNSYRGAIGLYALTSYNVYKAMFLYPDGTWTWGGTAVQLQSDRRVKQQISKIDNALLDAWEDVDLVQFKYNDAVNEKGDNARLHTGYVVQQIDEACQKHNIDISEYGLYCHEEYPEETEEVEVTQDDGTTIKETKVIEEASEHYSLRYTETLVVECAYLRRENTRLKERLQRHDDYFSNIEKRLQSLENS